MIEANDYCF